MLDEITLDKIKSIVYRNGVTRFSNFGEGLWNIVNDNTNETYIVTFSNDPNMLDVWLKDDPAQKIIGQVGPYRAKKTTGRDGKGIVYHIQ
jgi:hypothetical protein